jgi:tetratricopeptide (TPR) repeat protein
MAVISGSGPGDIEPDATAVINALMHQPWRIIHIAGHGEPPSTTGTLVDPRGVVLSGDAFLGPREIGALRVIPELVFVNCCHLASGEVDLLLKPTNYDRARFASGVAHALIKGGVRCVVAAGWAVEDEAASAFASTFYRRLLRGDRFIDAVAEGRTEARACGGNTWAAYQCYGDPDWRFRQQTGDAQRPTVPPPGDEFASIASTAALILALDTIAVETEFQARDPARQADRLRYLETAFGASGERGDVAEAFGTAWSKVGGFDEAAAWYKRARAAEDGSASLKAIEQLANALVRAAWNRIAAHTSGSESAYAAARAGIAEAMRLLDTLLAVAPTLERESIYGSAYKRLAQLEAAAGRADEEQRAIAGMWKHYAAAEGLARKAAAAPGTSPQPLFYPAMNRIAAQLAHAATSERSKAVDADTVASIRSALASVPPDFWSVVGHTELDMYVAVANGALADAIEGLIAEFLAHHSRVSSPWMWGSVLDNATFVLARYRRQAPQAEARAADRLLAELADFAGRTKTTDRGSPPPGRSAPRTARRRPMRSPAKSRKKRPRNTTRRSARR